MEKEGGFRRLNSKASQDEIEAYRQHVALLKDCPIPSQEILANLGLFLNRSSLSHILFLNHLYEQILSTSGMIMEFGVRWGRNLALFTTLRTIYEPYNSSRRIVGFDTFTGFPSVSPEDGHSDVIDTGSLAVTGGYEGYLGELLASHERLAPRSNLRKFEIVKGDVTETLPVYLQNNPETIVALAYFDMDLYKPTQSCIRHLENYITRGSIIVFDEVGLHEFPGETAAVRELGLHSKFHLRREPMLGYESYLVVD